MHDIQKIKQNDVNGLLCSIRAGQHVIVRSVTGPPMGKTLWITNLELACAAEVLDKDVRPLATLTRSVPYLPIWTFGRLSWRPANKPTILRQRTPVIAREIP